MKDCSVDTRFTACPDNQDGCAIKNALGRYRSRYVRTAPCIAFRRCLGFVYNTETRLVTPAYTDIIMTAHAFKGIESPSTMIPSRNRLQRCGVRFVDAGETVGGFPGQALQHHYRTTAAHRSGERDPRCLSSKC